MSKVKRDCKKTEATSPPAQEDNIDELISSIVKTEEDIAAETTIETPSKLKTDNCFKKSEIHRVKTSRQLYPEYYKLYERRRRLLTLLKKDDLKPDKKDEYEKALEEVKTLMKELPNRPPRGKF